MEKETKKEALIIDIATTWSERKEKERAIEKMRIKKNNLDVLIESKK